MTKYLQHARALSVVHLAHLVQSCVKIGDVLKNIRRPFDSANSDEFKGHFLGHLFAVQLTAQHATFATLPNNVGERGRVDPCRVSEWITGDRI